MCLNKSIFIFFLTSIAFCNDCPEHYITIENECYFEDHIHVLQDFIDLNNILIDIEPQNIGTQSWKDGKLTYLYLGNHHVTTIPDSIGYLVGIKILDLSRNKISLLPEGICNLYPNHIEINLTNNQICPPYPFCFEYVSHQETDQCKSFNCPENYIKIENECYNKNHVNVLDSIIKHNPPLSGLTPLELGQDLGYQFWENGQLVALNLVNNRLTVIPEEICTVYHELEAFDVSNNNICPPYPTCLEYIGKQNIENVKTPHPIKLKTLWIIIRFSQNENITEILISFK
jgi:Leucine Rich Repeat.